MKFAHPKHNCSILAFPKEQLYRCQFKNKEEKFFNGLREGTTTHTLGLIYTSSFSKNSIDIEQ